MIAKIYTGTYRIGQFKFIPKFIKTILNNIIQYNINWLKSGIIFTFEPL